jgi:type IV secretory pathway TrbF-like protein
MQKFYFMIIFLLGYYPYVFSQNVGINDDGSTPNASAMLDVKSTNKGFLAPRLTETQKNAISSPAIGLLIFQTDGTSGFYYYDGSVWQMIGSGSFTEIDPQVSSSTTNYVPKWNGTSLVDGLLYDNGTNIGLGTTSPVDKLHVVGKLRIDAGKIDFRNTGNSVFIGEEAGLNDDLTDNSSTFVGHRAGRANTNGFRNNAIGSSALASNTTGNYNNAVGGSALLSNTTGYSNNAIGDEALRANTTGANNVAVGDLALSQNTSGSFNSSIGTNSLQQNTTGVSNIAFGYNSLSKNTTGQYNVSLGSWTLRENLIGNNNTAVGYSAGYSSVGSGNVFLGYQVGFSETGSNKLYIDNSNTSSPLIYGEFDNNLLRVNGALNINGGNALFTGTSSTTSGIEIIPRAVTGNGGGRIFFREDNNDNFGISIGYNGGNSGNEILNWGANTFNISTHSNDATGVPLLTILRAGGNIGIGTTAPTEKLEISGKTKTTTFQMTNGASNGYVLQSDASGNSSWVNSTSLSITETDPQVASSTSNYVPKWNGTSLVDGLLFDNGTNVGLGTTSPNDKLHIVGKLRIDAGKIDFRNTGNSVFIGEEAGLNDDLSDNRNIFIGYQAGKSAGNNPNNIGIGYRALTANTSDNNVAIGSGSLSTNTVGYQNVSIGSNAQFSNLSGDYNTTIGNDALRANSTGNNNVAIGHEAGFNATGSGNVFLGKQAGQNETGSNKLYIDNSNTSSPLLYGEFDTNFLRINGTLNINNAYSLPTVAGTANYILQTNGAGTTSWVNSTSLSITETDPKVASSTSNYVPKWNGTSLVDGLLYDNGTNIGIGTSSPSEKLEVSGKTKTTTLQMTNGAMNGYILQSDALGNASWVNSTSLSITESDPQVASSTSNYVPKWNGTSLIDGLLYDNGTNIGIGTTSPSDKLHIIGKLRIDAGKIDFRNTGESVFIGENAGANDDLTDNRNVFVGYQAGQQNTTGANNVGIGYQALRSNTATGNTAVGRLAGFALTSGANNSILGEGSLASNTTGSGNVAIGSNALRYGTSGSNNVGIGASAGTNNSGTGSIFLGNEAGQNETGSYKLYIDNSNTSSPLIYGEFDNNLLRVNGTLNINNSYSLPTVAGTANYILQTDGAGTTSWVNSTSLSITETDPEVASSTSNYVPKWNGTSLVDGLLFDNGTNVGLGTTSPNDKLHIVGKLRIDAGKIDFRNTGASVFIGEDAGLNDDLTGNLNVFVGYFAGKATTTGSGSVAVGAGALETNTSGFGNTAVGRLAGLNNTSGELNTFLGYATGAQSTGSGNIFLGSSAGFNETGSNKLYIENSSSSSPLIYGEFDNDLIRINGTLNINNAYSLPTVAGTANYILQTDGAGTTSWVNSTSLSITESDPQVASSTSNYVPKWDGTSLVDGLLFDNGTNIGLGTTSPSDKLHIVGKLRIDAGKIDFRNTGNSVFIGQDAGLNDDLTNNYNTYIGFYAGKASSNGFDNVAVGAGALETNTSGSGNTIIGRLAGLNNVSGNYNTFLGYGTGSANLGSGNIFLGFYAGNNETGSNKLYIDNSSTSSPLIYGEFDNNLIRINGTLNINNAYSLPTVAGTANYVLQTDGAGTTSWVNSTSLSITESDPQVASTTSNYIPKWNGTSLVDGILYDNGTNIGIGTTSPSTKFHVYNGDGRLDRGANTAGIGRIFTINGARSGQGSSFAQLNFENYDNNSSLLADYVGASIGSQNTGSADAGDLRFSTYNGTLTERMIISKDGYVGIGTSTPTQALLVVNGSQNFTTGYGYLNSSGSVGSVGSQTNAYSIYASARIAATEFNAYSDARIKKIKGLSNSQKDLQTLSNIRITDYQFVDSISKGNNTIKKVIAQELKTVYPQAVSTMIDVIPNIYQIAEIQENGRVNLHTNLKKGEKVKVIFEDGEQLLEVLEAEKTFFMLNTSKKGKAFVFGKEVSDFHTVDYEALTTLNISATQEILKRLQVLELENQQLKSEVNKLEQLSSEVEALKQLLQVMTQKQTLQTVESHEK